MIRSCEREGGRFAVIEVTSEGLVPGFARAWQFSAGAFTNLTQDHLDFHGSMERYADTKAILFQATSQDQGSELTIDTERIR